MKKAFLRFLSIFVIGCLFFSCNPATGDNYEDEEQQQQGASEETGTEKDSGEKTDKTPNINRNYGVKFDFADAQALAKLEAKQDGSRAVTNADELGDLVKILADGSMENAITVGENCSLSDIVAIYKSPLEDSKDIFIVFNGESVLGYEEVEKEYEWGGTYTDRQEIRVGQLICLHEDGSIADILKKDNPTDSWNTHMSLKTESVTFDATGNLYFISSDNGDMIYQYNSESDELTKMVAAVEGTNYEKMQIDDEGEWIFVSGNRYSSSNSYFLRAIPISNPNGFVNVYYSSNYEMQSDKWAYDDKNGVMYFVVNDGGNEGLFTASKDTGFKNKKFIHCNVGENIDTIFDFFNESASSLYWYNELKTNGVFDSEKTFNYIICNIGNPLLDLQSNEYKQLSKDDVDIRFDKFFSATGKLKALAVLTAGKKNEAALEALNNKVGMAALLNPSGEDSLGNNWFENQKGEGYSHNFLADIIYVKDSDVLLVDSDEIIFEYNDDYIRDENGQPIYDYETNKYLTTIKTVKGKDLFLRTENGLFYSDGMINLLGYTDNDLNEYQKVFGFSEKYYKSGRILDTESLLKYFFNYCNLSGEKEFNLTYFKDDENYKGLYTTLTNEDAIKWLASDIERLILLSDLMYNMGWFDYYKFMNFLSKTCFIAGTAKKAISWNCETLTGMDPIYYRNGDGKRITLTDGGIYYEFYNTSGINPYYYIVQLTDSNGKVVELVNKLPLPSGKVVKSEKNKDRILLQYSVMDENGAELGYHHIYSVEMVNGLVTNCFDNVPNRNALEVVSFNSAGDLLYYSAVRGTSVENGIVNIVTNEYNPLTVQRKMVAVYTFN